MPLETILLPDPCSLDGVRSLKSIRSDILDRPSGYLELLRNKYCIDSPQVAWTKGNIAEFDALTQILAHAASEGKLPLVVNDASKDFGYAISRSAFRKANLLFDIPMSLLTCTFCVWPHLSGSTSLEMLNSGQQIWVPEAYSSAFFKRGHPSKEDIIAIGNLVIEEYRMRDIVPVLSDLWDEILERVEFLCGGCSSAANVRAIVNPSVPATWHKRGPKRGRGSQARRK